MILNIEILLLFLTTILFTNQIVIILEKEKLDDKMKILLKMMENKSISKKELENVRNFR